MPHTDTLERTKIKIRTDLKLPSQYSVIYVNDEVTSFDFVITTLMAIFDYTPDDAASMAHTIHEEGLGIVAVLPYETAEQKSLEVMAMAKISGFPLTVRLEPVD